MSAPFTGSALDEIERIVRDIRVSLIAESLKLAGEHGPVQVEHVEKAFDNVAREMTV
jgi:hypothetical protein